MTVLEGAVLDSDGRMWVGGSREAWEAFSRTASSALQRLALVALLEAMPGEFGERARAAYKLHGRDGAMQVVEEHGVSATPQ